MMKLISEYAHRARPQQFAFREAIRFSSPADRATHNLHPYPGKMLPQVAALLVETLSRPGHVVLDPFCGSGTVALEAVLAGRRCIARDQNPFACLLTRVKVTPADAAEVLDAASQVSRAFRRTANSLRLPGFWDVNSWYPVTHLASIRKLRSAIDALSRQFSRSAIDFINIAFLSTARSVSLADPAFSVPVRLSTTRQLSEAAARHLRKLDGASVLDRFMEILNTNLRRMSEFKQLLRDRVPDVTVILGDSRTAEASRNSELADLVLTSPPYPGAQKYVRASFPALEWLRLVDATEQLRALQKSSVGRERYFSRSGTFPSDIGHKVVRAATAANSDRGLMLHTYFAELYRCFRMISRATRKGGRMALVVSPNRVAGVEVPTPQVLSDFGAETGWRTEVELVDNLLNSAQPTKRHSSAGPRIAVEHVLVLARNG